MENVKTKWVFLALNKTRIIKELERAYLINLGGKSTILPKVFKRTKESETHIYFSLPENFRINVRYTYFNQEAQTWDYKDIDFSINEFETNVISLKELGKEIVE